MLLTVGQFLSWPLAEKQDIPVFTSDDHGIYFQRVSSYIYGSTTEYYGVQQPFLLRQQRDLLRTRFFRDSPNDGEGGGLRSSV